MDPAEYLDNLRRDGNALAAAARGAPRAAIPSCPGWDMTDLVGHVGGVHRWAAEMVRARAGEFMSRRDMPSPPDDEDGRLAWYEEGLQQLLGVLRDTDPDDEVWNWSRTADKVARFWYRRMALETAVHRWDAQAAGGEAGPVEAALALDGVDEYFDLYVERRLHAEPVQGLHGSLHLHATDGDGEWWIAFAPDHLERRREHAKADAAVRGPASALLLWVWHRRPDEAEELTVFGDTDILKRFGALAF